MEAKHKFPPWRSFRIVFYSEIYTIQTHEQVQPTEVHAMSNTEKYNLLIFVSKSWEICWYSLVIEGVLLP